MHKRLVTTNPDKSQSAPLDTPRPDINLVFFLFLISCAAAKAGVKYIQTLILGVIYMTGERDLMLDGMLQFAGIVQNHAEKTREEYDRQASEKATKEQAIRTRAKMMGRAIASREVVVREQNVYRRKHPNGPRNHPHGNKRCKYVRLGVILL